MAEKVAPYAKILLLSWTGLGALNWLVEYNMVSNIEIDKMYMLINLFNIVNEEKQLSLASYWARGGEISCT